MADDSDSRDSARPLSKEFGLTVSAAQRRAAGNPVALKALTGIERRTAAAKERARELHRVFEQRWVANEILRLWHCYVEQSAMLDAPVGAKRTVGKKEFERMATIRIQARTNKRLAKIEGIKTRMSNAVVRNLGSPSLTQSFNETTPVVWSPLDELMRRKQRRQR